MKFDKTDIERRTFTVLDDMIFLDEGELEKYINTCDARFDTENFVPNIKCMIKEWGVSEDDLRMDSPESRYRELVADYDEDVADLLSTYDIEYFRKRPGSYVLSGKYKDLVDFSKKYSYSIDLDDRGEALAKCADECDIDTDSGDDDFILGRLSG